MIRPRQKVKKCAVCKVPYPAFNSFVKVCGIPCSIKYSREQETKRRAKELKKFREETESKGSLEKKAQAAFNLFIRLRDHDKPCISCGTWGEPGGHGGYWDAGHYCSVGSAPELRFEPLNCHKQCKRCNHRLSGNIVNYRKGLKLKIGEESLAWLEGPHKPAHRSKDDLRDLAKHYRALAREKKKEIDSIEGDL